MTTDLEHDIRDALHARAERVTATTLRYADAPRAHGRRVSARTGWAVAVAATVVAVLAIILAVAPWRTGGEQHPASGPNTPAANTSWRLVRADSPSGTIVRAGAIRAGLRFESGGRLIGDDGVHAIDATYAPTRDGFDVMPIGTSANGYVGHDRRLLAVLDAMGAVFHDANGGIVQVEAQLRGDRMTLLVSGYILQLRRVA